MTALPPFAQTATHWPPVVPALTIPLPVSVRVPAVTSKPSPAEVRVLPFKSTVTSLVTLIASVRVILSFNTTVQPFSTAFLKSYSAAEI